MKRYFARICGLSILLSLSVSGAQFNIGDSLTVAELGVNPNQVVNVTIDTLHYSGGVYAGVNQLLINGTDRVNGFCIDPFHFSSSQSLPYRVVALANAPKDDPISLGGMGAGAALLIQRLWGTYYSPTMTASTAAGLQIAIWELVGGSAFHLNSVNDYGAGGMLASVESPGYTGPVANLVALTGNGQDYVVENVPDGAVTALLLGLALLGLHLTQSKFSVSLR